MSISISLRVPVRSLAFFLLLSVPLCLCGYLSAQQAGFASADITPKLGDKPVYMAGFGQNRKATKVHDPLMARAVVLKTDKTKIAIVSIDVVGFGYPNVLRIRKQLPDFTYVLVTSTHNHEGPDTIGLWGKDYSHSGVDPDYIAHIESQIVKAVKDADKAAKPATAVIGKRKEPDLLHDGREPYIKHDELVALMFREKTTDNIIGIVVQWNCHPETLDSKNTELSADFVGYTVKHLDEKFNCPVVYLTGTVGGLMTSLNVPIRDATGVLLKDGTFEKTERYGKSIGVLAEIAVKAGNRVRLEPIEIRSRQVYIPLDNKGYQALRRIGTLKREAFVWADNPDKAEPADDKDAKQRIALQTEVAWLRLGDLEIAAIPGEIYPELVLDKVQDPPDPGADFPDAPIEPAIYKQLKGPHRMLIGLANDEIGYIIPKRQWDEKPPYCYGRKSAQYGEINSVGPETAPILCKAFADMVKAKK
jgi:hypothetical protein